MIKKREEGKMKKLILFMVLFASVLVFSGCETIKGVGEDVSTIGNWLSRGSDKVQNPE